jgi:hypothetical protein
MLALSGLALGSLGANCGQQGLAVLPGVVNNPQNRTLRRELFAFATSELCDEMKNRSLPLKMRDADPSIGRFFPVACMTSELESGNLFVQFTGHGYAWTNVTGRMGFQASAAVEFDQDFLMEGSSMYVYFRQRDTQSKVFTVLMVESPPQGAIATNVLGGSIKDVTQQIGERVLSSQLARGFTVVREDDGTVGFSLGVIEKGQKPTMPFERGDSDLVIVANDRSEIHSGQRDFVGPFEVGDDEALSFTIHLEGAPAIDALVVSRSVGDAWIERYEREPVAGPPPGPALFDQPAQATPAMPGQQPMLWRRTVPLPRGSYYLVLDNSATAGVSAPANQPHDDRAALVSFGVQRGDRP